MKYDSNQIKLGIKQEAEHKAVVSDPKKVLIMVKEHLKEIPDYYTRLHKMEREALTLKQARKLRKDGKLKV